MSGLAEYRGIDELLTCGSDPLAWNIAVRVLIIEESEWPGMRRSPDEPLSKVCAITGVAEQRG